MTKRAKTGAAVGVAGAIAALADQLRRRRRRRRDGEAAEEVEGAEPTHRQRPLRELMTALEPTVIVPRLHRLVGDLGTLIRARLWIQVLIGAAAGIGVGLLLAPEGVGVVNSPSQADEIAGYLALPGDIFLALLKMIVVPLVVSSIILGISASGDLAFLRRVGGRVALYFVATTSTAVALGLTAAAIIRPGDRLDPEVAARLQAAAGDVTAAAPEAPTGGLPERIVSIIPTDPIGAALDQNLLQLVVFAILFGVALLTLEQPQARPVITFTGAIQELSLKVVTWAMLLAPLAVFGLMAKLMIEVGFDALGGMSAYVATVLLGLGGMVAAYVAMVVVIGGRSPRVFLRGARDVQLLAFSTSSSASVMPLTMSTAHDTFNVPETTTRLVVPLGATINMDGTALYQVVASMFMIQFYDIDVTLMEVLVLAATVIGASIGTPSTPGVGIVILATVLSGVGVPPGGIALIVGVDRILDMSRTVINVTGDLTACIVLDRWVGRDLDQSAQPSESTESAGDGDHSGGDDGDRSDNTQHEPEPGEGEAAEAQLVTE
ncbi:MAG: dicarboxylate/amino acid:cation symporter [Actinomycetota bacterium]|nr:dicarboxylate/amino acid:cation symporter [Actinomycetota bacterium]